MTGARLSSLPQTPGASPEQRRNCAGPADAPEHRIFVTQLTLSNFRNYEHARLVLDGRPVVLVGDNGAGKTSLLEAVSLLGAGQGLRAMPYGALARTKGSGGWAIAAKISRQGESLEIGTGFGLDAGEAASGRMVRIDGKDESPAALGRVMKPVWLIPAMDGLFTGPASERRRFLDRLVLAVDPRMRAPKTCFERAMRQRNRLFQMREGRPSLFAALEEQMAEAAVAIAAARLDAVARMAALIEASKDDFQREGFPWAALELSGTLEEALVERSALEVEDLYRDMLERGRERDQAAMRALEGPHLSDLVVLYEASGQAAALCSSGEQKALLLGLIIAQARLLKALDGAAPLILLDEIAAHLDQARRKALFSEVLRLGSQAWMTGTDADLFQPIVPQAQILTVNRGTLSA